MKKKPVREKRMFHPAVLLSGAFLFDEVILRESVSGLSWWPNLFYIILFCVFAGGLLYVLTSFFRSRKVQQILRTVLMAASGLGFCVSFFIYKQFKVFYDLRTMSAGASDALGNFQNDIRSMLLSYDGISRIILFFLPAVLYAVWLRRREKDDAPKLQTRALITLISVSCYLISLMGISNDPVLAGNYTNEYNYQSSVDHFGLIHASAMDLLHDRSMGGPVSFETTGDEVAAFDPDAACLADFEELHRQNMIYEKSVMNIDFDALMQTGDEQTQALDAYVSSLQPSHKNYYTGLFEGRNLIMITAEAFSGKIISPGLTPTLYRLANNGIQFRDYTLQASAGTTGGEYQILMGMLPVYGGDSLKITSDYNNYMTIASQLNRLGYAGWAFHNNLYTYYERDLTHNNLGYSNGYMGYGNGMEEYVADVWPQSDLEMIEGTLPLYLNSTQPFCVYYMTVSGHSGYAQSENAMTEKNWDRVQDLPYSDTVKGYYAANLELEDALTYLLQQLEAAGKAEDTVIVISGDHFPYGLDAGADLGATPYLNELYGYEVSDYLHRDENTLIIWSGCLETGEEDPIVVEDPVSSIDILPTLSNLFGTEWDSRLLPGRDVFSDAQPLVFNLTYDWKTDLGTYIASSGTFTPVSDDTVIPDGYVDHIRTIVRNKISYCTGCIETDYFGHIFGN